MSPAVEALTPEQIAEYKKHSVMLIDVRTPQDFSEGLIPGSINIPYEHRFDELMEQFVFPDRAFVVIPPENQEEEIVEALKSRNYSNMYGYLKNGFKSWLEAGNQIDMAISISPYEFSLDIKHDDNIEVFDLRPEDEFKQKYLEKTMNKSMEQVMQSYGDLQNNKTYYLLCRDGAKSMGLISYLKAQGKHNLYHIDGGFQAVEKEEIAFVEPNKVQKSKSPNKN